jgi:hypothetical protein
LDKGLKSEDSFRPPPGLVTIQTGLMEGEAPLDLTGGVSVGIVEDHMKVCHPPPLFHSIGPRRFIVSGE